MSTQIFESYEAFSQRKDKTINGVSQAFAEQHDIYERDNQTNLGCWNCLTCRQCINCIDCEKCTFCLGCRVCEESRSCIDCTRCDHCDQCIDGRKLNHLRFRFSTISTGA